jgi:hypothetical protein
VPKKPKAVPYLTVGFGTRPQRLKLPPGMTEPPKQVSAKSKPVGVTSPTFNVPAPTTTTLPTGEAPPGRPPSNLGNYLIKPTIRSNTGFEMINTTPDALDAVNEQYLRKGQLPMALQPKYLRKPEVLDTARKNAISKGWRKPRSRQT